MKVISAETMRGWEAGLISGGTDARALMAAAGRNIAAVIRRRLETSLKGRRFSRIVFVCGGGNNGGDGLAAAAELKGLLPISMFLLTPPERMRMPARLYVSEEAVYRPLPAPGDLPDDALIVDAVAGIGVREPLREPTASWVRAVNASGCPVISVDLPSGLDADLGEIPGSEFIRADLTVVTGAWKAGNFASTANGELTLAPITDDFAGFDALPGIFEATCAAEAAAVFRRRPADGHKKICGRVAVAAGSERFGGAAILAAAGAGAGGAGVIRLLTPASALVGRAVPPQIILEALPGRGWSPEHLGAVVRAAGDSDVLLIGPGMGDGPGAEALLGELFRLPLPVVADADALNFLSRHPEAAAGRRHPLILTPHPGEAARLAPELAGLPRRRQAEELARRFHAVVILKGYQSVVASCDGRCTVNPTGTPVLATAGSGDVLAGFLAALLCGCPDAFDAARGAAWFHGLAASAAIRGRGTGADELPGLIAKVCCESAGRY